METTTSFDLNRSIQNWRENLGQSPAFQRENLDELETHLRDSMTALQTHGLSTEEAFVVATARIGKNRLLGAEFGKINGQAVWFDRMLWMLIGIQVWGLVSGLMNSISSNAVSLGLIGGHFDFAAHGRTFPMILFGLVRLLAIAGSLGICWWLIVRKGQSFGPRIEKSLHRRAMLAAVCGSLCVIFLSSSLLIFGSQMLLLKFTDMRTFGEAMAYSNFFGWAVQGLTLIVLTLFLARKRLRLSKA
ncbi:MAG: hypothetical protein ABIR24_03185 [Verrucomicrobiota bacterium]